MPRVTWVLLSCSAVLGLACGGSSRKATLPEGGRDTQDQAVPDVAADHLSDDLLAPQDVPDDRAVSPDLQAEAPATDLRTDWSVAPEVSVLPDAAMDLPPPDVAHPADAATTDGPAVDTSAPGAEDAGLLPDSPPADLGPAQDAAPPVVLTSIEIVPGCAHLEPGRTFTFKAWGATSNGDRLDATTLVSWSSSNPAVAIFSSGSPGTATGVTAGDFVISATSGSVTATLAGRVATWRTQKLDYDVLPGDFHAMTSSWTGYSGDRVGLAVASWMVPEPSGRIGVGYREYDPATGIWSPSALLDTGTEGEVTDVRMRVGPTGDLLALWQLHYPGTNVYEEWATDRVAGTWRTPVRLSTEGSWVWEASLSMNHRGSAMAIWNESRYPDEDTRVALYYPSVGWRPPVNIGTHSADLQIDYDDSSHAVALWSGYGLQSRHYAPVTAWDAYSDQASTGGATYPGMASEGWGNVLAAWAEIAPVTGARDSIVWVGRYGPTTGWSKLAYYGWVGTQADFPSVGGNRTGGSVVTWEQYLGSGSDWAMYATVCPVGKDCDLFATPLGGLAHSAPQSRSAIAVHPSGAAVVVWSGIYGLNISRYYPRVGWTPTERLFAERDAKFPWNPRLFIDDQCRVFLSWQEDGAASYITDAYASVFR